MVNADREKKTVLNSMNGLWYGQSQIKSSNWLHACEHIHRKKANAVQFVPYFLNGKRKPKDQICGHTQNTRQT